MKACPLCLLALSIGLAVSNQAWATSSLGLKGSHPSKTSDADASNSSNRLTMRSVDSSNRAPLGREYVQREQAHKETQSDDRFETRELDTSHIKSSQLARHAEPLTQAGQVEIRPALLGKPTVLKGWADAVPLSVALEQVVPSDWKVEKKGIDEARLVSWKGEREWTTVLEDIAKLGQVDILVEGSTKTLHLMKAGQLAVMRKLETPAVVVNATLPRAKPDHTANEPILAAQSTLPSEKIKPLGLAPYSSSTDADRLNADRLSVEPLTKPFQMEQSWEVVPTKTLRENIEEWAKRENWIVVWEGADYPIYSRATFKGSFTSSEGPLAQLIGAYDDSEQPLRVVLKGKSRVVHVTNRNYSATTVDVTDATSLAPRAFMQPQSRGD